MKFKFSLQKVLEHRKILEELAQKDFQDAVHAFQNELNTLNRMEQEATDSHVRASELTKQGGHQGPALVQIFEFQKGQKVLIARQIMKAQEAEKLVEAKREILKQAALDYKIMEKMRENKFEEYKRERLSQEQKEMDEQSILRFKTKES
jgi:flagellar FliJ protein